MLLEEIKKKFISEFNKTPLIVRSPGRVNIIGEHTDYNEGFVLPAAIDKEIVCAISANYTDTCKLISYDMNDSFEFDITNIEKSDKGWPNYILGVVTEFQKKGLEIKGFDCIFGGDIPLGAGLSSSAALECAFAFSFNTMFEHQLSKIELVKIAQSAENNFVGVKCGIMDQFVSVHGKPDKVIHLDCKTLDFEYYDLELNEYRIILCDTQVKHSLGDSEYNTRRHECETGVGILREHYPDIHSLRDVDMSQLLKYRSEFDPVVFKRCKYVIEENERVLDCCMKLVEGNVEAFGQNMFKTHEGLSKEYEVSCKELDFLVDAAKASNMVIGARMMGGGFGGCTINLVKIEYIDKFIKEMTEKYYSELGLELKTYIVKISNGTSKV
jgi:galactokinase